MRALLSVADREGISAFARQLRELDVEVYATDGTREHLAGEGIEVAPVSDLTHVAPLIGGQVKTFHPLSMPGSSPGATSRASSTSSASRASARSTSWSST